MLQGCVEQPQGLARVRLTASSKRAGDHPPAGPTPSPEEEQEARAHVGLSLWPGGAPDEDPSAARGGAGPSPAASPSSENGPQGRSLHPSLFTQRHGWGGAGLGQDPPPALGGPGETWLMGHS